MTEKQRQREDYLVNQIITTNINECIEDMWRDKRVIKKYRTKDMLKYFMYRRINSDPIHMFNLKLLAVNEFVDRGIK